MDCVFCEIVAGRALADIVMRSALTIAFRPLDPVTPGHLLVVPKTHVADATEDIDVTLAVARSAAALAAASKPCNLITSVGAEATQSVFHLHWHVVPRRAGDGLALPWSPAGAST